MTSAGTTQQSPNAEQLMWVLQLVGGDAVADIAPLRDGGSPFLIRWVGAESNGRAILRIDDVKDIEGEAVAELVMPIADRQGVPVPNVIGSRLDDDTSLLLVEWIDGSSAQPREPDVDRLESLGAMAAVIFRATPGDVELPRVTRPIRSVDFAALRAEAASHPLLERAARRVAETVPDDRTGLVHGDLWAGNTLWRDNRLVAVIDWDCAGVGPAGVDLGSLRLDAAMAYGPEASAHVLSGWETEAAAEAESVAYWDAVAALNTPPDLGWFVGATVTATGRDDLTQQIMLERRDAFLDDALARLG